MSVNYSARSLRLRRLFRHRDQRLMVVPLDHSIADGPLTARGGLDALVGQLVGNGVDAVVLHKGSLRHVRTDRFTGMSLIMHLSASTAHAPDPDAKYLVTGVEEALRQGADAVSVHVNLGSRDERQQIADLGAVADVCDRWNVPLLAMMYPRGPKISNPRDPELVVHTATLAADLGADIVKTLYTGSSDEMADIVEACPIPVIVAGGVRVDAEDQVLDFVGDAIRGGAAGVAMGRNVFQAPDPGAMARKISQIVHSTSEGPGTHSARREAFVSGAL
ncbi:2-amino-3,7-dideoxy-D-threo-hept-6-ulosonate synthase [Streptomyces showdoensis]|uniref:2-amino-4,5-dihydroxy-6-one-heptanoic acid-7-phosphate synthase n=1 Tax=Streptomyces showdoensis TaxID=68268 RepID=A0A2P2GSP5_STREW|nr:2-amino-3,7-dideoxy-D-threo-hept-6-ulosonate synthase [Streptomyces showdoensis]KKZ74517.1 2-amino-4,5-dihydroxy-6-one-heptanoic acid-7-phosphate synthase [Streptomyces showdoensis]